MNHSQNKPVIAVVGAGPAGSSAAIRFGLLGHKVVLIDKAEFPRNKVCGDGIPAKVLKLCPLLNIQRDELGKLGFPIFGMHLYGPAGQHIQFGGQAARGGAKSFCIPRTVFDHFLFQKATALANEALVPYKVSDLSRQGNRWKLFLRQSETGKSRELVADLVIAADGGASVIARKALRLKPDENHRFWGLRQYFSGGPFEHAVHIVYDARLLPGYIWVFPVAKNRVNVGLMVERHVRSAKPSPPIQALFEQILRENSEIRRILKNAKAEERYSGAPLPLGTLPGRRVTDGLILIGDAAAFINPITGGGIYHAMHSGIMAAEFGSKAVQQDDLSAKALSAYENWWRKNFLPGFKTAGMLRRLMQSEKKANKLFDRMQKHRIVANLFIAVYGQPLPKWFYLHPLFWAGILLKGRKPQAETGSQNGL